ncbi:hypothetical protein MRX96_047610 [Rhipicephalus microplus]
MRCNTVSFGDSRLRGAAGTPRIPRRRICMRPAAGRAADNAPITLEAWRPNATLHVAPSSVECASRRAADEESTRLGFTRTALADGAIVLSFFRDATN